MIHYFSPPQKKKSDKGRVVLRGVTLSSTGEYKCEVSAEAPNFRTKSESQDLVAVSSPKSTEIVGADHKYRVGDVVNVTCFAYQ